MCWFTAAIDQPGHQHANHIEDKKDFHRAHRRAGHGQRGTEGFWNKEAADGANCSDETERGGGIGHRFMLGLIVAAAALLHAINGELAEDHGDHLEGGTAAKPGG